jgi:hypothetical protein
MLTCSGDASVLHCFVALITGEASACSCNHAYTILAPALAPTSGDCVMVSLFQCFIAHMLTCSHAWIASTTACVTSLVDAAPPKSGVCGPWEITVVIAVSIRCAQVA